LENQKNLKTLVKSSFILILVFFSCKKELKKSSKEIPNNNEIAFIQLEFENIYKSNNDLILESWLNYTELAEYINQFNSNDFSSLIDNKKYLIRFFNGIKNTIPDVLNQPEISSRLTVIETDFLKLESMLSNFEISSDQKNKMVKRINNSFSNLNFQIDKVIEKLEITPLL
tara:strand:- start:838 stop:1350 length:513 start_codon:yes stop_codon:yes gene_type:complete